MKMKMKMKKIFIAGIILIFFMLTGSLHAQSLWNDNANWFADERPGRVGDIVTVLIDERTDAKDESTMDIQKSANHSFTDGTGILKILRGLSFSGSSASAGDGSIERKHHATGTLACLVTEVLPNGNLIIEGTRDIRTSEEILQFQLIGVIRPQDVNSDNEINSKLVANAELSVKGHGTISRTQNPGIVTRILQTVL